MDPPTGTITFLFTDIEGSTKLWERCPDAMRVALATHDLLVRHALERNHGYVFKTVGDAFCAAFTTASDALNAALEAHFALLEREWDETGALRIRIGIHTGDAEIRDDDYFGPTVNRVARLQSIAYGAQTLISQATFELVRDGLPDGITLIPLGAHRLKDLNRAEQVFQVDCPGLPADFPALKSLDAFANNLPIQMTSFIGREQEMDDVNRLLSSYRLVTLLGPGGTGKSRLSLQVGADRLDQFADGVWFVELAPISDPAQVAQAIAAAMGIKEEAGRPAAQTLVESLKLRNALIILDNCEHLLDACARLVQTLLQSCSNVRLMASSREAFNIPGESIYRVPPLRQPEPGSIHTAESLSQFEAVRLFIDRAVAINAAFKVTNENAPALAQLCARLDGIPLAIELAAGRVRSLSIEEINRRLVNCFALLTGGSRTALPRQQTLRALIDWSYDLLTDTEKTVLQRVSVFSGGWTLEAAEQVCSGDAVNDWEVLDLLTSLADKSLIISDQENNQTRYRILDTIRQYADDRLQEHDDGEEVRLRHLTYFLSVSEADPEQRGPEAQTRFVRLKREHGNLRAALDWALNREAALALRLAAALGYFYYIGGYLHEGRDYLERALAAQPVAPPESLAAEVDFSIGRLAIEQGDYAAAEAKLTESVALANVCGNRRCAAGATNSLGIISMQRGDLAQTRACFEQCLAIQTELGSPQGIATAISNLGTLYSEMRDYATARDYFAQGVGLYQTLDDQRGIATCLFNLGGVCSGNREPDAALAHFERALVISRELADDWYISYALTSIAALMIGTRDYAGARALAEESLAILRAIGDRSEIAETTELLGRITMHEGRLYDAQVQLHESLSMRAELGQPSAIAAGLEAVAEFAIAVAHRTEHRDLARTRLSEAASLLAAAEAVRASRTIVPSPNTIAERAELAGQVSAVLDPESFDAAWAKGAAMCLADALDFAFTVRAEQV